ncbi:hypothetical protein BDR03DRAFT_976332 [Suillus americanus]|nr:hypothetical protein BDR03DRAFT_976332 [Suillus americanus]
MTDVLICHSTQSTMVVGRPEQKVTKRPSMAENLSTASEVRHTALVNAHRNGTA